MNREIEKSLMNKPRLVLLHRCDLISKQEQLRELEYFKQRNQKVLLTSVKSGTNMNAIIPSLSIRQSRFASIGSYFAVMGIPNVGKSSIIGSIQKSSSSFRKSGVCFSPAMCRCESACRRHSWSDETRGIHQGACSPGYLHD